MIALAGCPASTKPTVPAPGAAWSRELGTGADDVAIRGLDVDAAGMVYVAAMGRPDAPSMNIAAIGATGEPRWTWTARGAGAGPVAVAGALTVAVVTPAPGAHDIPLPGGTAIKLRGEAGAGVVGLRAGAVAWHQAVSASDWAVIAAIAGHASGDVVAVGSFAGVLRVGNAVVTSAGNSDGFAVRFDPAGNVRWLVRGGAGSADAFTAVAVRGAKEIESIAVAGSITGEADFRGTPLVANNPRTDNQDVAVVVLDGAGMPRWGRVIGGDNNDAASGVAIADDGAVVVAGTVRDVLTVDGVTMVVRGTTDAIVARYDAAGTLAGANLLGADDIAGARGVAIGPDGRIVVAGTFSGVIRGPNGDLTADGGDDAFVATIDRTAHVTAIAPISGPGREDIVGLASSKAGIAYGVAHTAELIAFGAHVPAPRSPTGGVAVFVQP